MFSAHESLRGTEVSWLPLLCIQKGVMYEGYMHKPEVITAIEKDLLNSTFLFKLYNHVVTTIT